MEITVILAMSLYLPLQLDRIERKLQSAWVYWVHLIQGNTPAIEGNPR